MEWTVLRDRLHNHRYEVTRNALNAKEWTFASAEDDPIPDTTFTKLGAGTNKMAVRVDGTEWVLLFGKTGRPLEVASFREEVDTLKKYGARGLRVPKPFESG